MTQDRSRRLDSTFEEEVALYINGNRPSEYEYNAIQLERLEAEKRKLEGEIRAREARVEMAAKYSNPQNKYSFTGPKNGQGHYSSIVMEFSNGVGRYVENGPPLPIASPPLSERGMRTARVDERKGRSPEGVPTGPRRTRSVERESFARSGSIHINPRHPSNAVYTSGSTSSKVSTRPDTSGSRNFSRTSQLTGEHRGMDEHRGMRGRQEMYTLRSPHHEYRIDERVGYRHEYSEQEKAEYRRRRYEKMKYLSYKIGKPEKNWNCYRPGGEPGGFSERYVRPAPYGKNFDYEHSRRAAVEPRHGGYDEGRYRGERYGENRPRPGFYKEGFGGEYRGANGDRGRGFERVEHGPGRRSRSPEARYGHAYRDHRNEYGSRKII